MVFSKSLILFGELIAFAALAATASHVLAVQPADTSSIGTLATILAVTAGVTAITAVGTLILGVLNYIQGRVIHSAVNSTNKALQDRAVSDAGRIAVLEREGGEKTGRLESAHEVAASPEKTTTTTVTTEKGPT